MHSFDNVTFTEIVLLGARDNMNRRIDVTLCFPTARVFLGLFFQKSETVDINTESRENYLLVLQNKSFYRLFIQAL